MALLVEAVVVGGLLQVAVCIAVVGSAAIGEVVAPRPGQLAVLAAQLGERPKDLLLLLPIASLELGAPAVKDRVALMVPAGPTCGVPSCWVAAGRALAAGPSPL